MRIQAITLASCILVLAAVAGAQDPGPGGSDCHQDPVVLRSPTEVPNPSAGEAPGSSQGGLDPRSLEDPGAVHRQPGEPLAPGAIPATAGPGIDLGDIDAANVADSAVESGDDDKLDAAMRQFDVAIQRQKWTEEQKAEAREMLRRYVNACLFDWGKWTGAFGKCVAWQTRAIQELGKVDRENPRAHEKYFVWTEACWWNSCFGPRHSYSPGHNAIRFTFPDGTMVYIDDGNLGGADQVFWPPDVPGYYHIVPGSDGCSRDWLDEQEKDRMTRWEKEKSEWEEEDKKRREDGEQDWERHQKETEQWEKERNERLERHEKEWSEQKDWFEKNLPGVWEKCVPEEPSESGDE